MKIPVIVNGDITDLDIRARRAGPIGRRRGDDRARRLWPALDGGRLGLRRWPPAEPLAEPSLPTRFEIMLAHLARSLKFYGEALGLRVFRKHLGWYVENAPLALFGGDAAHTARVKVPTVSN